MPDAAGATFAEGEAGAVTDHLHVAVDAEPHLVAVVRFAVDRWLKAVHWPDAEAEELVFAISEAVSNSVEHAYRELRIGVVTVDLCTAVSLPDAPAAMDVVVTDFGRWRPERPGSGRGNGLALIRAMVAASHIDTDERGTRVRMRSRPLG